MNILDIADNYFDKHPDLVADVDIDAQAYSRGTFSVGFMKRVTVNGKGNQSIEGNLLVLITRITKERKTLYVISPRLAYKSFMSGIDYIDMHRHNYYEFFGVLDGVLDISMEHSNKRYLPGDFCLINQNVFHSENYSSDYTAIYISLNPDYFNSIISSDEKHHYEAFTQFALQSKKYEIEDSLDFSLVPNKMSEHTMNETEQLLGDIIAELLGRHTGYMDIVTGYIKRLFAHMQHSDNYSCVNTVYPIEKSDVYHDALTYIHSNRRKLSRNELASALNYNGNYLADLFRKNMGITVSEYIRDICMQEAASLLLNTDMNIHEIAAKLGYENRTVFYNNFYKKYKMTPKEYREMK